MVCLICLENNESYFKCRNCVCVICTDCYEKLTTIICIMCRRPSNYLFTESIGDTFNKSRNKIIKAEQLIFAQFMKIKKQSKGLPYKLQHFIAYSKECIYNDVIIDYSLLAFIKERKTAHKTIINKVNSKMYLFESYKRGGIEYEYNRAILQLEGHQWNLTKMHYYYGL